MANSTCSSFLTSTIGKKYLVAATAVFWVLFVLVHMLGNMLIFVGAEAYNKYSHALTSNPLIYVIETVLVILLLTHAFTALGLKVRNWKAKPQLYAVRPIKAKAAPVSSSTMAYTGTLILAFIIWHLITFKYGPTYFITYQGVEMRDIYKLVMEKFQSPIYVGLYGVCLFFVGMHLYHGVGSMFQTMGVNHPRYNIFIRYFSYAYSIVVTLGYISQPLYVYLMRS